MSPYESVQPQESDVARELIMLKYFSLSVQTYEISLKRVSTRDHATRSRPKDDKVHVVIFK